MTPSDCILLITTCARNEAFVPEVLALTKHHWPGHPPPVIVTDGDSLAAEAPSVLRFPGRSWLGVLSGALERVRARTGVRFVFLMLEDLCPQRPCSQHIIDAALALMRSSDAGVIQFSCFDAPFENAPREGVWASAAWHESEVVQTTGLTYRAMPTDLPYYFSVQPAIWDIDYLLEVCRAADAASAHSPWAFEALKWRSSRQHLIARYVWPSMHHGFLMQGKPNRVGLARIDRHVGRNLLYKLVTREFGSMSRYRFWRFGNRVRQVYRARIAGKVARLRGSS